MVLTLQGLHNSAQQDSTAPPYVRIALESQGTLVENCEDAWTANANVTCTADTTAGYVIKGTSCAKNVVGAVFTSGIACYEDLSGAAPDLTGETHLTLWINSSCRLHYTDRGARRATIAGR